MGLPLPGEITLLAAAGYAGTGQIRIQWVIVVAASATIIGGCVGYLLGRWAGHPLLVRFGHYVFLNQDRLFRLQLFFERQGDKTVFFARFVTGLRNFAPFLAGANEMPAPRFLLFNAAGGITWSVVYGVLAYELGRTFFAQVIRMAGWAGLALLVVGALVMLALHHRSRRPRDGTTENPPQQPRAAGD